MQTKFDPKVFQLGYVALGTPDIQRAKDHYLKNLGMTEVARDGDGSVYLSMGYNHHDIVLRPAAQKALLHVGFHLKPHITVGDFARDVREIGLTAAVKTDSQPGVAELVEVEAPGGDELDEPGGETVSGAEVQDAPGETLDGLQHHADSRPGVVTQKADLSLIHI